MNEIVSLTIMLLMCVALIAGQATARPDEIWETPDSGGLSINVDISFRHDGE